MSELARLEAVTFDVFGTVVDWRTSVAAEAERLLAPHGFEADWERFADAWRARYQPSLTRVRTGELPWTKLDDLHRMNLEQVLVDFGVSGLGEAELDELNRAWHRLNPWPDAVPGLTRLKRRYIIGSLSNGNVALIVNMAKHAAIPWDVVLGAEPTGHYKPQPQAYLGSAALLGLRPAQCMLVAAHNGDLAAAAGCGLRTAFVPRPREHGPGQTSDLCPEHDYDIVAEDFLDLATRLGC